MRPMTTTCPSCDGSGTHICGWCNGNGTRYPERPGSLKCWQCGGGGEVGCWKCEGTGTVEVEADEEPETKGLAA